MYELSIKYHVRHKDIGDNSGKFIANINLGLNYTKLSKIDILILLILIYQMI